MKSPIALGALLATVLSLSAFAATPVYRIKEIPARVGERYYETPFAMNDLGQFVGSSVRLNSDNRPISPPRAYLWDPATGKFQLLALLNASHNTSAAGDINNHGRI